MTYFAFFCFLLICAGTAFHFGRFFGHREGYLEGQLKQSRSTWDLLTRTTREDNNVGDQV